MRLSSRIRQHHQAVVGLGLVIMGLTTFGSQQLGLGWLGHGLALVGAGTLVARGAFASMKRNVEPALARLEALEQRASRIAAEDDLEGRMVEIGEEEVAGTARALNRLLTRIQEERESLASLEARAQAMAEASPNGVVVVDGNGRIAYYNPAFGRIFGLEDPVYGLRPLELPEGSALQKVVDGVRPEGEVVELTSTVGEVEMSLVGVALEEGEAMVLVQDITRFHRAEQARADFVTNVSHELRTPIATIRGYAETLEADPLPDSSQRMVQAIVRSSRRLSALFEDLLSLARMEARRRELPISLRNLRPMLEQALLHAAEQAGMKGQSLELECDDEVSARVNQQAFETIVSNLAVNACHYTQEGGQIRVVVVDTPTTARVDVIDNGPGIDESLQARIFERFFRADFGRARKDGGTGLGLAIVKHLCAASGAEVSLRSKPGEGSTFSVHFPRG